MPLARRTRARTSRNRTRWAPLHPGRLLLAVLAAAALSIPAFASAEERAASTAPVAGAFVYPVGDELDFTKPHAGEPVGFHISDSYLVIRHGKHGQRSHKGVDLANGRGGSPVRAIGSGVVVVSDAKAMIKVRRTQRTKVPVMVNGKRVYKNGTRYRWVYKWRTGWGNYVVIRHVLPDGETVHSLYGHLKPRSVLVKQGDVVAAGQVIAQVGRTGHATSAHLHLEIRKSLPASDDEDQDAEAAIEEPTVEDRTFALLATVDPVSFLSQHVRGFDDLDPRSWEAPYALAACRDGIVGGDEDQFDPDESITRSDFYAALVMAFRLNGSAARPSFLELQTTLAEAGALTSEKDEEAGGHLKRSEALEILLRCLDKAPARGQNLAAFDRARLCGDFNRVFAGAEAALQADREAVQLARAETAAQRKAAEAEFARAVRGAGPAVAAGAPKKRIRRRAVKAVVPVPRLDPGFEAIARSDKNLSRAEACLLLASAFRLGHERTSALERAATRVATASPG
ncbi:MAG TPA: peptidoglycan DD-metalloendopeptidase family protein [Candidatus Limnocylindrales bacterium]|nr:peptidoglycan DD-metalloendopeptidase family protein [Candidatus Limnocylindrales bacterium]